MPKYTNWVIKKILIDYDFPILTVEVDNTNQKQYLSHLYKIDDETETRIVVPIEEFTLSQLEQGHISIYDAFTWSNSCNISEIEYSVEKGVVKSHKSFDISIVSQEFLEEMNQFLKSRELELEQKLILEESKDTNKVLLNIYLNNQDFVEKKVIRPWAFRSIIAPLSSMIKKLFDVSDHTWDSEYGYTLLKQSSLSIAFQIPANIINFENESHEFEKLKTILELLSSKNEENFINSFKQMTDKSLVSDYSRILSAIANNNAWLDTTITSPTTQKQLRTHLSSKTASQMRLVLSQVLENFTSEENFEGYFQYIDMTSKESKFGIKGIDGKDYSGKFSKNALAKTIEKDINFKKKIYRFKSSLEVKNLAGKDRKKVVRTLLDYEYVRDKEDDQYKLLEA